MALQDALNIFQSDGETEEKLAQVYAGLLDNVQKGSLAERFKNTNYSGDPKGGSIVVRRIANAGLDDYGDARTAGKGTALENTDVVININDDKEIVEELEMKDVAMFGVDGLAEKRRANHANRIIAYKDNAFFGEMVTSGTEVELSAEKIEEQLEEMIQSVETTSDDFTDGVERDQIVLSVKPAVYGKVRNYIDSIANSVNGATYNTFHDVEIVSNHRQTKDIICFVRGAVAQPTKIDEYAIEKVPFADAIALETFIHMGTKAVYGNLCKYADLEVASL